MIDIETMFGILDSDTEVKDHPGANRSPVSQGRVPSRSHRSIMIRPTDPEGSVFDVPAGIPWRSSDRRRRQVDDSRLLFRFYESRAGAC